MDASAFAAVISRKQGRPLDRLRDRRTDGAAGLPGTVDSLAALIGDEFALLVTFRRSGEPGAVSRLAKGRVAVGDSERPATSALQASAETLSE